MRIIRPVKVNKTATFSRNSVGTYWDKNGVLQTAVANAIRISYDPSNLTKAPFAMDEGAATNLSGNFTPTWYWDGGTLVETGYADPAGGTLAARWTVANPGDGKYMRSGQNGCGTFTDGSVHTASVFMKYVSGSGNMYLGLESPSQLVIFDPATRTVSSATGGATYKIEDVGNGWFRLQMTFTPTATGNRTVTLYKSGASSGVVVDVFGPQIELGSVATSYITTTTGPATRAADVITGTGLVYSNVPENDYPVWSSTKQYVAGDYILDLTSHKIYQSLVGVAGTTTFTAGSAGNAVMKKADGTVYVPAVGTPVTFTGTPPTGIVSGSTYYVQAVTAGAFSVSSAPGGAAITTGAQATPMTTIASANVNVPVPNVTYWLDSGYDNRWEMFDDSVTSQTSQTGDVTVVFVPGARLDAIAGLNMAANSMKVAFTDISTGTVVYSGKANLISNSGIQDLYDYMYEPIVQMPDCLIDAIPLGLSTNSIITVTFQSNGTTKVGGLIFGLSRDIGVTEWGAKVGIVDYSVKTKDTFGNYNITPRTFSKKGDFTVQVPTGQVDSLQNTLAQYRSTPIVYIGSNANKTMTQFNSTIIYGFYKDFDINISYNAYSVCSISIEGLT